MLSAFSVKKKEIQIKIATNCFKKTTPVYVQAYSKACF